ncbi:MAG: hypothetical protein ACJ78Q_18255 [Chloroflexia bacterium]
MTTGVLPGEPIDVPMKYHVQDNGYYCSAACAQMVLRSIGAAIFDQGDLDTDIRDGTAPDPVGWRGGPDGMELAMRRRNPPGRSKNFAAIDVRAQPTLERNIVWALCDPGVASLVPVFQNFHWVAVSGCVVDRKPARYDDNYDVIGFLINNPQPEIKLHIPRPHNDGDDCGRLDGLGLFDGLRWIDQQTWRNDYLIKVPKGKWAEKYVAVIDPDDTFGGPPMDDPEPDALHDAGSDREHGIELTPDDAVRWAISGLKQRRLDRIEPWKSAIGGQLDDLRTGEAYLVERLDIPDQYYYLVLIETPAGGRPVAVTVGAASGEFRESAAVPDPTGVALPDISYQAVLNRLQRNHGFHKVLTDDSGSSGGNGPQPEHGWHSERVYLGEDAARLHPYPLWEPHLVWRPCLQSSSPFHPFYLFEAAGKSLYIRVDLVGPGYAQEDKYAEVVGFTGMDTVLGFTDLDYETTGA